MNPVETFIDGVSEASLTCYIDTLWIMHRTCLVELSVEDIELIDGPCVDDELGPERVFTEGPVLGLELVNNLFEVPWECEYIRMLLL